MHTALMPMPVMDIRVVGVAVGQRRVLMKMAVSLAVVPGKVVGMLMMCVMRVLVLVR